MVPITWDVFIAIFILIIVSYSFIIGRDGTIKVIIASYIAVLTANGVGNLMAPYIMVSNNPSLAILNTSPEENVIIFKILLYVFITLVFVLRGAFSIEIRENESLVFGLLSTATYGLLSAALIISTILTFVTGNPTDGLLAGVTSETPISLADKTIFFKYLVQNHDIWFVAPAAVLMVSSMLWREEEG